MHILQLNLIKNMAYMYKEYEAVRNVSFKPSFVIQGERYSLLIVLCVYLIFSCRS